MAAHSPSPSVSKPMRWTGRVIGVLPALFLLVDAVMKLVKPAFVVEATVALGFSETIIVPLGVVLLACTILYLVPPTAIVGAILLTGYLGGAVATHVLVQHGWFEMLFPVIFGIMLWGGLWLRDRKLQTMIPRRSCIL